MAAESRPGPRPVWNWLAVAFCIGVLVVLFVPAAPELREQNNPTDPTGPANTITLEDLRAMLTDAPGVPPATVEVETPDGPVTVVIPPESTTTTTTSAPRVTQPPPTTTTTTLPRPPRPSVDDLIDDILGQSIPTTIPEGAGGDQ